MRPPRKMAALFFFFLVLSSAAILYATAQNISAVRALAIQALHSTALSLASSAENVVGAEKQLNAGEVGEIFSDRVVAYALIAQSDGKILFHTNPGLIGQYLPRDDFDHLLKYGVPRSKAIVLQTGMPAYEFDYIIYNPGGKAEVLRLVLHTTPVDQIVSKAERIWWTVGSVLFFLWATGILLWCMLIRYVKLQAALERDRHMAVIGQMTAVLAHEIRNALGGIKGFTQLADEKTSESDERKPALAAVLTGTRRIENLVNNLLLFSRDEDYTVETVDVVDVLRDALTMSFLQAWHGNIEFTEGSPVYVTTDRDKLHRVLVNGIRNAVESMGQTGVLSLLVRQEANSVVIRIEDTGPGISGEAEAHLFSPFYTTKADGTGLGLAYSEKVIKGMGGQIELSNRSGGGAVLTIRLPSKKRAIL